MKDYIRQQLREALGSFNLISTPKDLELNHLDLDRLKSLSWEDLILEPMNEDSPVKINVSVPWESRISDGVDLFVLLSANNLYQLDINIANSLQGLGLGYKLYKSMIFNFGHIYSGNGRRHNKAEVPAILNKLKSESGIEVYENNLGVLCVASTAEDKEEIIKRFYGKVD